MWGGCGVDVGVNVQCLLCNCVGVYMYIRVYLCGWVHVYTCVLV